MSLIRSVADILIRYKLFTAIMATTLFLLLIRLPLGTFNYPSYVDTVAHFVLPAVSAPLIVELLVKLRYLPQFTNKSRLLIYLLVATVAEVVWEIVEYCVDLTFKWSWQLSNADTMIDLILAVGGGIVGGYIFIKLYHFKP